MAARAPKDFERAEDGALHTNYYLLGMVIEAVSGQTYAQYLADHVFQPLAMSDTRLDGSAPLVAGRVRGYTNDNGHLRNAEFTSDTWAYAEGGVITTAEDLAKLDAALYGEKLIERRSIDLMWTPTRLGDGSIGVIGDNGAGRPITRPRVVHRRLQGPQTILAGGTSQDSRVRTSGSSTRTSGSWCCRTCRPAPVRHCRRNRQM